MAACDNNLQPAPGWLLFAGGLAHGQPHRQRASEPTRARQDFLSRDGFHSPSRSARRNDLCVLCGGRMFAMRHSAAQP
jgi:hypothetical protein